MDYKLQLETFAKKYGSRDLYPVAVGIIASINESYLFTPDEKVCEIGNALAALYLVRKDGTLPYEKEPTAETVSPEEITTIDDTPEWSIEQILRNAG